MDFQMMTPRSSISGRSLTGARQPDLIIGIDFGMTGTGVAYASMLDKEVKVLKSWPDAPFSSDKVPSTVAYRGDNLVGWGFGVRDQDNSAVVTKAFKGVLDQRVLAHFKAQNPHVDDEAIRQDAVDWLRDYLKQLRGYLQSRLKSVLPHSKSWEESQILFLFSYPATWDADTKATFEKAIDRAGYDQIGAHRVKVTMNEARAAIASVFARETFPAPGEHLIILDIGGGTSDVGVFAVQPSTKNDPIPHLQPKIQECGINIGSSKIDEAFERQVAERIKPAIRAALSRDIADSTVDALAAAAIRNVSEDTSYLAAKHLYGEPRGTHIVSETFPIREAALIGEPKWKERICPLHFNKDELFRPAYEDQCKAIWKLLLLCMKSLISEKPLEVEGTVNEATDLPSLENKKIRILLTGGMGQSPFVQDFLRQKLDQELHLEAPLIVAEEPRLVVCRGLVESELRELRNEDMWMYRTKAAYGIILQRATGEVVSTKVIAPKDAQIRTRQTIKVELRIPIGDYKTCEIFLAQFPDHVPKRTMFSSTNHGEARIIGPVLSKSIRERPAIKPSVFKMDPRVEVKFQFDSGHIRSSVILDETTHVGTDAYFGEQWQSRSVDKLADSATTRGPIGLWWHDLITSMDSDKAMNLTKKLGIASLVGWNFRKRQKERQGAVGLDDMVDDLTAGMADAQIATEAANNGVQGVRTQYRGVSGAFDGLVAGVRGSQAQEARPSGPA